MPVCYGERNNSILYFLSKFMTNNEILRVCTSFPLKLLSLSRLPWRITKNMCILASELHYTIILFADYVQIYNVDKTVFTYGLQNIYILKLQMWKNNLGYANGNIYFRILNAADNILSCTFIKAVL